MIPIFFACFHYSMSNVGLWDLATLYVEAVPTFWHTLQLSSSE
jgi:hypothetical protein